MSQVLFHIQQPVEVSVCIDKIFIDFPVAVVVQAIQCFSHTGVKGGVCIVTVLEPIIPVHVRIVVVDKWVSRVNHHFCTVFKTVSIGVAVLPIRAIAMVLFKIIQAI